VSNKVPFDKEKFLMACPCGCTKSRQAILDGIEKYRESDPKMVQYLEWYRDDLWDKQCREEVYRQEERELGDEEYGKKVAAALRAMADKVEQPGMHFIVHAELPKLPIFSGDDRIESYAAHIKVSMVAGPLGG
jgi:hypothetical protein